MQITPCTHADLKEWARLRYELWPIGSEAEHRKEAEALLGKPEQFIAFLARTPEGKAGGFAEATLRRDYVNGCTSSPVAFLEGIYVRPDHRHRGIARLLVQAVQDWAVRLGCREFASDAELHNTASHAMHLALGFEETERVIYFRKALPDKRA